MLTRSLAIGLLAAGCLTAAAGGSYLAVRQNATTQSTPVEVSPAPAVNETEAIVTPNESPKNGAPEPQSPGVAEPPPAPVIPPQQPVTRPSQPIRRPVAVRAARRVPTAAPAAVSAADRSDELTTAPASERPHDPSPIEPIPAPLPVTKDPPRPAEPLMEEIILPASSVVGLELETTVTSERARLEDRVDARVTRDVYADGRLAIPAGSRVIGAVTTVDRGGKVKERARLAVRFHTLVLANGRQVTLRTEPIVREGESPSNESSRKIGGAAIGGAVLGAILGGGKGAIAGATAGAAGGTAAVMAGGRNAATLGAGSIVTVKLTAPASFEVER